jgi:hypothetical protein
MVKFFLPIAVALLLSACAGTTGVTTAPHCIHCAHHCEHCKECKCRVENKSNATHTEKPCKICMESERASAAK